MGNMKRIITGIGFASALKEVVDSNGKRQMRQAHWNKNSYWLLVNGIIRHNQPTRATVMSQTVLQGQWEVWEEAQVTPMSFKEAVLTCLKEGTYRIKKEHWNNTHLRVTVKYHSQSDYFEFSYGIQNPRFPAEVREWENDQERLWVVCDQNGKV